jgi:hypothetical protein
MSFGTVAANSLHSSIFIQRSLLIPCLIVIVGHGFFLNLGVAPRVPVSTLLIEVGANPLYAPT